MDHQIQMNKYLEGNWSLKIVRTHPFSSIYVNKTDDGMDIFYNFGMVLWYNVPAGSTVYEYEEKVDPNQK